MEYMNSKQWTFINVLIDIFLVNLGIITAFLIRYMGHLPPFNFQAYTNLAFIITVIQIIILYVYDLYNLEEIRTNWDIFNAVLKAVTLGFLLIVFVTFFYRFFSFPRTVLFLSWFLDISVITLWHILAVRVLKIKWPLRKVLIVGTDESCQKILKELKNRRQFGYKVIGLVDRDKTRVGQKILGTSVLGTIRDIVSLVRKYNVNQIIVTSPIRHRELIEDLTKSAETYVKVDVIPDLYEIFIGKIDYFLISDIPLVELTKEPVPPWVQLAKRIMDVVLAFLILILTSPFVFLSSFLIKLTSKGSILYRQRRVGKNKKVFDVFKFRTMKVGAEEETGPVLASENDPRITFVGKYLRKTRMDELPQLFNVLRGDMSFVGPRPERPAFVNHFLEEIPGYSERFRVKPGITGLAQVSGFYATTARNKLKYDLIYIYHQSFFLDFKIILQTFKVVLTGRGAQ
jgi:exopolysaccharide biosynthesis polyprenyl glycosylphosphotransferase